LLEIIFDENFEQYQKTKIVCTIDSTMILMFSY